MGFESANLLSLSEAAKKAGIGERAIRMAVERKKLKPAEGQKTLKFTPSDVAQYISDRDNQTSSFATQHQLLEVVNKFKTITKSHQNKHDAEVKALTDTIASLVSKVDFISKRQMFYESQFESENAIRSLEGTKPKLVTFAESSLENLAESIWSIDE